MKSLARRLSSLSIGPDWLSRAWMVHALGALTTLTLLSATFRFGILPNLQEAAASHTQSAEHHQLVSQIGQLEDRLHELDRTREALRNSLEGRYDLTSSNEETCLGLITRLVMDQRLQLISFSQRAKTSSSAAFEEVELRIEGSYQDVCRMLDGLDRVSRPVHIVSLQVTPNGAASEACQLHCELQFFPAIQNKSNRAKR